MFKKIYDTIVKPQPSIRLNERAKKYLKDVEWVQKDIWKIPSTYPAYDPAYCEVFSDKIISKKFSAEERKQLEETLKKFHMIMQGPFWLGDNIVVGGFWNKRDTARNTFGKIFKKELTGKRVLEIGSMSGYDSFFINLKKPEYYLSIEPSGYFYQTILLNSIYKTNIDFKQWFWQDIPHNLDNSFDIVINTGCLYHESDFVSMIKRTTELLKTGGETIVATTVISDSNHQNCIKYMPDTYAGDMTYWFAIGEEALMSLYKSYGCEGELVLEAGAPGDSGNGFTVEGYPCEKYNFYKFTKTSNKNRPLITIPKY